jgi:F0F1-type ATP synthase epsilon subunit
MDKRGLYFVAQTPSLTVFSAVVESVRLPTETGQVGLRRGMEPIVLPVEPGLVLLRAHESTMFMGCAGGLLIVDTQAATLLTPLAVVGVDIAVAKRGLDEALAEAPMKLAVRKRLRRLEDHVLTRLHGDAESRRSHPGRR